jgi:hypothetical protein
MSPKKIGKYLPVLSVTGLVWVVTCPAACGDIFDYFCGWRHCPPAYIHCQEEPPKLKFKKICPKPVCNPCCLPHYGYFATCWHPWPFPPDYSHCPFAHGGDLANSPYPPAPTDTKSQPPLKPDKVPGRGVESGPGLEGIKPMDLRMPLQNHQ